jgi:hypothetical protein
MDSRRYAQRGGRERKRDGNFRMRDVGMNLHIRMQYSISTSRTWNYLRNIVRIYISYIKDVASKHKRTKCNKSLK